MRRGEYIDEIQKCLIKNRSWFNDDWQHRNWVWKLDEEGRLTDGEHPFDVRYATENPSPQGRDYPELVEKATAVLDEDSLREFKQMLGAVLTVWQEYEWREGDLAMEPQTEDYYARLEDKHNALQVDCPKCPAAQFERCRSKNGKRTATHVARITAGKEAAANPPQWNPELMECNGRGCKTQTAVGLASERGRKFVLCESCSEQRAAEYAEQVY